MQDQRPLRCLLGVPRLHGIAEQFIAIVGLEIPGQTGMSSELVDILFVYSKKHKRGSKLS